MSPTSTVKPIPQPSVPEEPPKISSDWKSVASSLLCSTNGDATVIRDALRETDASAQWIVMTVRGGASWRYQMGDAFENTDCGFYEVVWKGLKGPNGNCNQLGKYIMDYWVNYGGSAQQIKTNIENSTDI